MGCVHCVAQLRLRAADIEGQDRWFVYDHVYCGRIGGLFGCLAIGDWRLAIGTTEHQGSFVGLIPVDLHTNAQGS